MSELCPVCGLPKELCMCAAVAQEKQKIVVKMEKRRFGKPATVIEGLDAKEIDMKKTAKQLKEKLACGGTVKGSTIELQGDHRQKVKTVLKELGFPEDSIEVR